MSDVMGVLWRQVERAPYPRDSGEWAARVLEAFDLDDPAVQRLRSHRLDEGPRA